MRGVLLAICFALGCAHQSPRAPPLTGWRELRSTHFTLRTNLPEDSARSTLEKLETLRWWLQVAWSTGGDSPGTTDAIVLGDPTELLTFTPSPGVATLSQGGPLLVTAGQTEALLGDRSPGVDILAHEVAHELIQHRMPGAPRWFHEGLAGYLETIFAVDDRHVRFGILRADQLYWQPLHLRGQTQIDATGNAVARKALSLDETESRRWESAAQDELTELYASARLWVGVLRTEEPTRMRALEAALAGGTSWRRAWADLRSGLDLARLQEKMFWSTQQSVSGPTEVRAVTPLPVSATRPVSERLLARWEVHLVLAELWAMAARTPGGEGFAPRVRTELEAAAAAAPAEPLPQLRLIELERDPDARRARAEALVQRFPTSAEARVFLARVLRDNGGPVEGRREAALAAIAAAPDDVDALTAHAIEEVRAGNAVGALRSVARAEALEPWNPAVFVARALVLESIGLCEEAADAVQRALDVLPDNPPPGDVQALVRERERIARTCARAGP
ncbi:MAG: hypothetical protein EHM78_15010 [Myxococcaceae bacterium]|nr:MAG: hypothetical protein EHM78_15010 [Myxococcaceae bacterium]